MEATTTATAAGAISSPLWIQVLNPYVQLAVALMGGFWIAVQIYYKIKSEWK